MSRTDPHLEHMSEWCAAHRGSQQLILAYIKAQTSGYISAAQLSRWLSRDPAKRKGITAENFLLLAEAFNHTVKNWKDK